MPNVTRRLPAQPHLDVPKREARELLKSWRAGNPEAFDRIRGRHPRFRDAASETIVAGPFRLSDAQLVIAREYTFSTWAELKRQIELNPKSRVLEAALYVGDRDLVINILRENPELLHLKVRSGHWGPPMSFAVCLDNLEMARAIAALGAKDFQHALGRALLSPKLDCAIWLADQGAELTPDLVMGACETLNANGLRFLAERKVPLTDEHGNRLAPLAMLLETYSRHPARKHAALKVLEENGHEFPSTPIMAFHRGRIDLLEDELRRDPGLLGRRFSYGEIYPPSAGCSDTARNGLHGTPLDGTTLLHLAIDFDEQEIFDWLLAKGAEVNARALVDAHGFGGHTPLFNCVVSDAYLGRRQRDAAMTKALLDRGASPSLRASVRKFLDWIEEPHWHEARDVTPAEWGRGFPERTWVNPEAMRMVEAAK